MTNGSNSFGVSYSQIVWLHRLLSGHPNVQHVLREQDIVFHVTRSQGAELNIVCLDEYTCGVARVLEVLEVFNEVNFIYVGGSWNGYTKEAKEYCLDSNIGLFNTSEMTGALHRDDFWAYHQRDQYGNPIYPYKAA